MFQDHKMFYDDSASGGFDAPVTHRHNSEKLVYTELAAATVRRTPQPYTKEKTMYKNALYLYEIYI